MGGPMAPERARRQASIPRDNPSSADVGGGADGNQGNLEPEALNLINEYFYGVRVFPGQDPNNVYVGWVTTQYHIHSLDFSQEMVRVVTIQQLDNYGRIQQR